MRETLVTASLCAPHPPASRSRRRTGRSKGERSAPNPAESIELVVLSLKQRAARCRVLSTRGEVTLRATRPLDVVPGEIVVAAAQARKLEGLNEATLKRREKGEAKVAWDCALWKAGRRQRKAAKMFQDKSLAPQALHYRKYRGSRRCGPLLRY